MSAFDKTYEALCQDARETALLGSIEALLGWDERTIMPPEAGEYRAEQITYLAGLVHRRLTDPRIGDWLAELAESPLASDAHSDTGATIRELRRQYERKVKLPQALVEELTRTAVLGQQVWQIARQDSDFNAFAPLLKKTVELKREQAQALGYAGHPYDALLEDYEPGESTAEVARVLADLRRDLVPLVAAIRESSREPVDHILNRQYPVELQESFGRAAAAQIGFDFQRGRLDISAHPFCSEMGPRDCRITTRYDAQHFSGSFFGILHEAGHGLYDQGLRADQYGLPLGRAVSLGIHESQSRMWENLVGRSRAFWEHFFPQARQVFVESLNDVSLDDFYFAINTVRPSLIRVEADEATYNLHILIRFELEQALLDDELEVEDLPGAWNDRYQQYLGITPPNDAEGVLQDIHWSAGLIGYFPTYSLGNMHAAQLFVKAESDIGPLAEVFARGEFQPLREWLRTKIHEQGQRYTAAALTRRITGKPLSHQPLLEHLRHKLSPLYGL